MAIETIMFDLGDVCYFFSMDPVYEWFAKLSSRSKEGVAKIFDDTPESLGPDRLHNTGKISSLGYYERSCEALGISQNALSFFEFANLWNSLILGPNKPVCDLINSLYGRYKLLAVSNTDPLNMQQAWRLMPKTLSKFEQGGIVTSYGVGVMKPNHLIYREALRRSGSKAGNCAYIDDKAKYAAVANELGMHGIVYDTKNDLDANKLKQDLMSLGVRC
ncbi:HAD-IA family hydrolase [Candidatus Woesearchaeota archaeon]|nr:HAD-IA family hydrolase [Candidatus Woesearchaeota archaeon]